MAEQEMVRYCNLMEDIKGRIVAVDQLGSPAGLAVPVVVRFESIYLQYRKILELIAFASLVSDAEAYSRVYQGFSKNWNAEELFRDLERANPGFYPKPKLEVPDSDPKVRSTLADRTSGYLTAGEFLELHGRSGEIIYGRDPFAGVPGLEWFVSNAEDWRDKIVGLLDMHVIRLAGVPGFHLVRMQAEDRKVRCYAFEAVENVQS
jgi:hypothetical protein